MQALVLAFVTLFGLMVGSFLNVVIYRLPRECLSVVKQTRSRCPRCSLQLRWFDNLPLFSYLILLRGKCRGCKAPISWRYPLIELVTGLAFLGLAWRYPFADGLEYPLSDPGGWLVWGWQALIVSSLIALSMIDLDYRILPDAITLPGCVLAPLMVFASPELMPSIPWRPFGEGDQWHLDALANGVVGAVSAAGFLWLVGWLGSKAFRKPAMGLGDVKLYGAMGGILGFWVFLVLPLASLGGSVIGLTVLAFKRDHYLPFGPFLAVGMVATMLWGPEILDAVLAFTGR